MSKSLISDDKFCIICGTRLNIHRHHIYEGSGRRKLSEKYGCWCYLCAKHHNMSNEGIHFNKKLDLKVKQKCQEVWESQFGNREDFIKVFGKSYLD